MVNTYIPSKTNTYSNIFNSRSKEIKIESKSYNQQYI